MREQNKIEISYKILVGVVTYDRRAIYKSISVSNRIFPGISFSVSYRCVHVVRGVLPSVREGFLNFTFTCVAKRIYSFVKSDNSGRRTIVHVRS